MSERPEDAKDWPLRDWSTRLRPPAGVEPTEPTEAEILYEDDVPEDEEEEAALELPIAAMALAKTRRYACVIALGCVIRGETPHFDFVASEAASGLQLAGIETGVPVSFGLLTCDTAEQAEARVERGAWAARTALEMADVFAQLRATTR